MTARQQEISQNIRQLSMELGFTDCGFASAALPERDTVRLREWLNQGMHSCMHYMENYFEKRIDPSRLVPGAKSIISVLLNYSPGQEIHRDDDLKISRYASGKDYHRVMKSMLRKFLQRIREEITPLNGRLFVDSAPVLERSLAAMAGLGWIGKNASLISSEYGSFVFIGELITDLEMEYGTPLPDRCGTCSRCINACPTGAIVEPGVIDSRRCISCWTIEHKGDIDIKMKGKFRDWIFGCDICQEVCPWNRKAGRTKVNEFLPSPGLLTMNRDEWKRLSEERFNELFDGSAVKRTKYEGLTRNIRFVSDD
jgi:epoxyqueuosine reductase